MDTAAANTNLPQLPALNSELTINGVTYVVECVLPTAPDSNVNKYLDQKRLPRELCTLGVRKQRGSVVYMTGMRANGAFTKLIAV